VAQVSIRDRKKKKPSKYALKKLTTLFTHHFARRIELPLRSKFPGMEVEAVLQMIEFMWKFFYFVCMLLPTCDEQR
jgi:hypothetical protein